MSMVNPFKEFGGDSNLYMNVKGRNFNTEVWFANLLSELIRRGIDSDDIGVDRLKLSDEVIGLLIVV